jgi:hypothetical protein
MRTLYHARIAMRVVTLLFGLTLFVAVAAPATSAWAQESTAIDPNAPPEPEKPAEKPDRLKAIIGYGLSIAGVFVVLAVVVYSLSRNLKYENARNALIHMLRTNPNAAEMQCQTMPHSFYEPIGAALKAGGMAGGIQDPAIIASATVPTYDAIGAVVIQFWKGLVGKAKLAAAAAVAGPVVKPAVLPIILAVIAVGGLVWLMIYKVEIDRTIFRAKVEVLPDVDRAFVDGRYYIPPKA